MPQQFTKEFQRKFSFKNMLIVKYMFLNKKETTIKKIFDNFIKSYLINGIFLNNNNMK